MPIDTTNDTVDKALQNLRAREKNFQLVEHLAGLASWEMDLRTRVSTSSERSYEIYGLPKGTEITLEYFFSILEPGYIQPVQAAIQTIIETGEAGHVQCKVKHTSGKVLDLRISAKVVYDVDNKPLKLVGSTQDITEFIATKEEVKELAQLIEFSSNEIYIINHDLKYLYVNKGAVQALGYTEEELLSMHIQDINPYMTEKEITTMREILSEVHHTLNRTIHRKKDGTTYHVQSYLHTLEYKGEQAYAIFDTDISDIIDLKLQHKKQARILEFIHESIITTDLEGNITNWNRGSKELFGYSKEEMLGENISKIYDKKNEYKLKELLILLKHKKSLDVEAFMNSKKGESTICDISLSISKDEDGEVDGYIGYIQDITIQKRTMQLLKEQTEKLKYLAHHDTLTDLPNRTLFRDRLSQAIAKSKRNGDKFALLFIDLDQFKKINDTLGHDVGDKVLIKAAKKLQNSIRQEDTLARLGGDEFCIILKDLQKVQSASTVAQKIVNVMKESIVVDSHKLYVTSSIGISIYPDDAHSDNDLIKHADVAMYKAKEEGRNNFQFYSSEMSTYIFERVVLESNLRTAIDKEEFIVYFQPQFSLKDDTIVGMEALVRWQHPSLGLIPPGKFIPISEENGLIIDIDRIVMKKAMRQFVIWYKKGLNPGKLSLNLAMRQLAEDDFINYILNTMNSLNFQAEWLELEVTEGQVMQNPEEAIEKLKLINNIGIDIAIDDFGTGYSSLSYLKKLPLDKLKIDQSFVRDIPENEDDMAITKAIIALAKSLNLKIIAEGVETEEQKEFLVQNNCDLVQGYFYSRPVPGNEIERML